MVENYPVVETTENLKDLILQKYCEERKKAGKYNSNAEKDAEAVVELKKAQMGLGPMALIFLNVLAHFGGIIKYFLQPISTIEYVINSKVKVVLKSTDQGLSISGLISLLI